MAEPIPSRLMVLMFTDIVGSVELKRRLGMPDYGPLLKRHDDLFKAIVASTPGAHILQDLGNGFFTQFQTPADAVNAALRLQGALDTPDWHPQKIGVRAGIHVGHVAEVTWTESTGLSKVAGLAADFAARVMSVALPGQILLTRAAFDDARLWVRQHPPPDPFAPAAGIASEDRDGTDEAAATAGTQTRVPPLLWLAHGRYLFKGSDEPVEWNGEVEWNGDARGMERGWNGTGMEWNGDGMERGRT